jgi:magnesium transporter
MIQVQAFFDNKLEVYDRVDEVPSLLERQAILWIDIEGEDSNIQDFLCGVLKLHPLAVEDILLDRPFPKIEDYGDYLYMVVHGTVLGREDPEDLETVELDMVFTDRWIFTHHRVPMRSIAGTKEELARTPRALERGPAFIAHGILDRMIDFYLPLIDKFDEDIDEVEAAVVENPSREVLQRIFRLKRSLQKLRRISMHQREILQRLSRGEFEIIPDKMRPFYRDVFDHFARVADLCDSYRELLSGALDAYLSMQSNKMNEIMKALTIMATIMLPITFIAGVYGMNFEFMPELHWKYGYLFAWTLMCIIASGMIWFFKRRRWI